MGIAITEEHEALQAAVRRFLEAHCRPAVPRALLEAPDEGLPAFWGEIAALGWLGLHLPEEAGGQGFGMAQLVVVIEEFGRACAPGPFVPTVLCSAALHAADAAGPDPLLASLADGSRRGALAFGTPGFAADARAGGSLVLRGTTRPVLGAALAGVIVAAAVVDGTERWCVLEASAPGVRVEPLPSLDATRRVGAVRCEGAAARSLAGLDRATVSDLVATVLAAECAGGARWCVDTAAEYAKVREQFGRPIGQFQAVKHRCADMLVAAECATGVVWDAARAWDEAVAGSIRRAERSLAAAAAASVATEAFASCAKDVVQVLGGIGFTWEHDAHLYLKRASAIRQIVGGAGPWRAQVAKLARRGTRRHLRLDMPQASDDRVEALRAEVRAFVASVRDLPHAEQRARTVDAGWFVPHWPPPWGRNAGAVEQLVIDEELRAAGVRRPNLGIGAWAAPTIAVHGTPEQQERWVRPTLLGEISWCQLFSEPGAGSDLASLTTKAVRVVGEGGWCLSGQKVWTSMAAQADFGICLARTDLSAPKHLGITYFVVDMRDPGIEVRPLRELTGHAMFNEVFLTDVFVADDAVIGPVDGGWSLARTTLANERVAMSSGSSFGGGIEGLLGLVAGLTGGSRLDAVARDTLGALVAEAQSVALLGLRSTARAVSGARPGAESSVRKLLGVEHDQRVSEFGLSLLGPEGATTEGRAGQWAYGFLANRCLTIAGGTSEIQRNVIAERLLGLPRDP